MMQDATWVTGIDALQLHLWPWPWTVTVVVQAWQFSVDCVTVL